MDTNAIATFDEHLSFFHCPLFTSLFLGRRRTCETADLAATLVGGGGQASVITKLESRDFAFGSGSCEGDATLLRSGRRRIRSRE